MRGSNVLPVGFEAVVVCDHALFCTPIWCTVSFVTIDATKLRQYHVLLLGQEPEPTHLSLYEGFPDSRGFSDRALNVERFEAVLLLGLAQTFKEPGQDKPNKTYLFVPATREAWAIKQLEAVARKVFARCKEKKASQLAVHLGELFQHLMLGSRAIMLPSAPERWAAFGFHRADPIPDWMRDMLLTGDKSDASAD